MIRAIDIEQRAQVADKALIDRGEKYIDEELEKKWQTGQSVVIGLSQVYPSRVANHLANMYRQAGWEVTVTTDREGGFLLSFRAVGAQDYYQK